MLISIHTATHFLDKTHTHIHPFNGPLSGTTQVSRYQKGKTNLDLAEARGSEWQWHQLGKRKLLHPDSNKSMLPHVLIRKIMYFIFLLDV